MLVFVHICISFKNIYPLTSISLTLKCIIRFYKIKKLEFYKKYCNILTEIKKATQIVHSFFYFHRLKLNLFYISVIEKIPKNKIMKVIFCFVQCGT